MIYKETKEIVTIVKAPNANIRTVYLANKEQQAHYFCITKAEDKDSMDIETNKECSKEKELNKLNNGNEKGIK